MSIKMSIWGVGRQILFSSLAWLGLTIALTRLFPGLFLMDFLPPFVFLVPGLLLLGAGVMLWIWSLSALYDGFSQGLLLKDGPYAYMRHPLYSAFILFIFPGLGFLFQSWLVLTTGLFAFILFRLFIGREEEYLEEKFGKQYREYSSTVRSLFPG
jgi:protein-S-isoprenylcysteine O-methyltransferase Ste14